MTAPQPIPYEGPGTSPLRLYLQAENLAITDIIKDLEDASADAQRRINKLETKAGIGSAVRRDQLAIIRRELVSVQNELWRLIGSDIRAAAVKVGVAAATSALQVDEVLFRVIGIAPPAGLVAAQERYAQRTVANYLSRGLNNIPLSQQVYRSKFLSQGFVDRAVNRVIVQGGGWRDIAKAVKPMIDPSTPGGVSYAAKRLARTELNNAFHTTQQKLAEVNPYVDSVKWNLSRSHPKADKCDELARGGAKGMKAGHYRKGQVPSKPHPQCLCYTTSEPVSEDEFLKIIMNIPPEDAARAYGAAARSA